ncbi:endonuclease/exonuclease/phosphatase family protein [Varibaculum vaginae]|uniref:endonuclease/exonuclease/phosphatase family protein n=1 Tax=Varibaculum vaginae TaxID=2364797 RepID=UPI00135AA855|nr:endonuclease/exonuclease/phosphatase family protein [Varibaculum vaginae]
MRIISANLQHGTTAEDIGSSRDCWQELARLFAAYHPDAICLQEVDYHQMRSGFQDQSRVLVAALKEATGQEWQHKFLSFFTGQVTFGVRFPAVLTASSLAIHHRLFQANRPLLGGYGVAILTPHPVRRWVSAKLGAAPPRIKISGWNPLTWRFYGGQTRSLLGAEIVTAQGRFLLGNTHLELGVATAKRQLVRSWEGLSLRAGKATPLLVGDFNLREEATRALYPYLTLATAPTFPASEPTFQIDQLFAPPNCQVLAIDTIQMPISDHRALFVELQS